MLTEVMGFGKSLEDFDTTVVAARDQVFEHSLGVLASALGTPIDSYVTSVDAAVCRVPTKLHIIEIPVGSVGGQRVSITGMRDGKPYLRFRSNWYVTTDLEPAWDLRADGWRVIVEGDTPLDMTIDLPMPKEEGQVAPARYTSHRPVNAIANVCSAPPGIVTITDMPQVVARLA